MRKLGGSLEYEKFAEKEETKKFAEKEEAEKQKGKLFFLTGYQGVQYPWAKYKHRHTCMREVCILENSHT